MGHGSQFGNSDARKPPCGGSVVHGVDPFVGLPMGRVDCQSTAFPSTITAADRKAVD
ncbi:Hypothetical protein EPM1_3653 [Stenotrophomonas maltophilia EPM1]|nr:Hypothetical protein EPM1_3653 [Stenotrophomonas maltophilia EPM1]